MELFPNGVAPYLVGGLAIGVGVAFVFLTTGIVAGASGVFSSTLSWVSRAPCFRQPFHMGSRAWRAVFSLGLVGGAALWTLTANEGRAWTTDVQLWRLALAGVLIGFGTRLSRGCTSGHGICGVSSGSLPSLAAVVTFMGVAIATAAAVRAAGVVP